MSRKRRNVILTLLLLLELCHGHPMPPEKRHIPSESNPEHPIEMIPQLISQYMTESDVSELTKFLMENDLDLTNKTSCGDLKERDFFKQIKGIPVAGELYELASSVMMMLEGCAEESAARLNYLKRSSENNPDLAEAVAAMVEALEELESENDENEAMEEIDIEIGSVILEEMVNATVENVNNMTLHLRVMEDLIPEENMLGELSCHWEWANNEESPVCPMLGDQWMQGNFLQAKLACERLEDRCVGTVCRHNCSSYQLLKECSANFTFSVPSVPRPQPPLHDTTWFKVCSENKNSSENIKRRLRRSLPADNRSRRDIGTEPSIRVYQHRNYRGASIVLTGAVESLDHGWNTTITSLKFLQKGWSVVTFQNSNFLGRQTAYVGNTPWVGLKWNDKISSLVVLPFRLDRLCFTVFEHRNFEGKKKRFCGDQGFASSPWKGKISSLRVESEEYGIILYDRRSHVGNYKWFSGNVSYVGNDWNDRTVSIQIRPWILPDHEGRIQPTTILYEHRNYRGKSITVKSTEGWIGNRMNDKVSSVQCEGQCAVLMFENRNYSGQSRLYDGSQKSVANFEDKLSSVLVLSERICVTLYEHRNYKGRSFKLCSDVDKFPARWNDRVSSLIVNCPYKHCWVILYEHSSYLGDYKAFTGKVSYVGDHWNDLITSLQIRPWKLDNHEQKSCVDRGEQKAHNVIQWIPFISLFYNLATSIYYGAVGCNIVAQSRAIDMALDVAMDVATAVVSVLTAGSGTAAVYGAKVAAKSGIKVGMQAAKKALTATVKNAVRNSLKSVAKTARKGLTGNIKSMFKSVVTNTKNIAKAAKAIPKSVKNGAKAMGRSVSEIGQQGIGKSTKKGASQIKSLVQRKVDDVVDFAKRQIDEAQTPSKSSGKTMCRRKRMVNAPGMCSKNQTPENKKPDYQKPENKKPDNQNVENKKPDSQKLENQKPENKKPDNQKPEIKKPDEQKPENKKPDNQKTEEQQPVNKKHENKPENQKLDNQKPEKQQLENKPENQKLDNRKPENQKAEDKKPDNQKSEKQQSENKKPDEQKPESQRLDNQKPKNKKPDNQTPEKQQLENMKPENKPENQKLDNRKPENKKPDNQKPEKQQLESKKSENKPEKQKAENKKPEKQKPEKQHLENKKPSEKKPRSQKPNNEKFEDLSRRQLNAQDRQLARRPTAETLFQEINKSSKTFKHKTAGAVIDAVEINIPGEVVTKDVLRKLAYYNEFMKDGATRITIEKGKTEASKYALKVNMKIGNEPFEFVLTPGRNRQIYVGFTTKIDDSVSHSYDGIIKQLDSNNPAEMQRHARSILEAIDAPGEKTIDWGDMTPKQREAAKELIVLTHVAEGAVPDSKQVMEMLNIPMNERVKPNSVQGGIGGIDKTARSYIARIAKDPTDMSFKKAFDLNNGEFIITRIGGKRQIKTAYYKPNSVDERTRDILRKESDAMSDSSEESVRKRRSVRALGAK